MQNLNSSVIISALRLKLLVNQSLRIIAEGCSMHPLIDNNDYIKIIKTDDYSVGDVVLYEYRDKLIAHRIVCIEGSDYIIMGDNTPTYEDKINAQQIIGKVLYVEKNHIEKEIENFKLYNIYSKTLSLYIYRFRKKKKVLNDNYFKKIFIVHYILHHLCFALFKIESKGR